MSYTVHIKLNWITVTRKSHPLPSDLQFYFVFIFILSSFQNARGIGKVYITNFNLSLSFSPSLSLLCSIAGLFLSVHSVCGLHHATILHAGRHHCQHPHILLPHCGPQRLPLKHNTPCRATHLAGESCLCVGFFVFFLWSVCCMRPFLGYFCSLDSNTDSSRRKMEIGHSLAYKTIFFKGNESSFLPQ